MEIPFAPFVLFFVVFAIFVLLGIAHFRSVARKDAGALSTLRGRLLGRGAYAYGVGVSALLSALTCAALAFHASRPTPPERRMYEIHDPLSGTVERRELTEKELNEQYETTGAHLSRIYQEHHDAGPGGD